MSENAKKLSTDPYKGVRDFYPENTYIQNYIFGVMRDVVESFGYQEYNASILEPAELYKGKTSEEIVNEQTYSFNDRADREVTLRPEMTPTVARMVAAKKRELPFPLRWYSIPNVFRYERPQKGRLREHWQLNVDLFGGEKNEADFEILKIAHTIMTSYGASDSDFSIKISHAGMLQKLLQDELDINEDIARKLLRIIDKREKISLADFDKEVNEILESEVGAKLTNLLKPENLAKKVSKTEAYSSCEKLQDKFRALKIPIDITPSLTRGFDYYTGIIFEVYDTDPENTRSLFGGGRFDNLLSLFGEENIPAVGFGMGDVTIQDFLNTHNLLPPYTPTTDIYICTREEESISFAQILADKLRAQDIATAVNITLKNIGDQIKTAEKQSIPFLLFVGAKEIRDDSFAIKNIKTGEEENLAENKIADYIFGQEV